MTIMLILLVLPVLVWAISGKRANRDANAFVKNANAFVKLGDLRGKTLDEIVSAVGPPSSASQMVDGELYQWIRTSSAGGYHVALLFKDGKCQGITHQHRS